MPIQATSSYRVNFYFRNKHLNTVHSHLFRKIQDVTYERTRIDTPDGDFLDIDLSSVGSDNLVLVVHGLEGSADSDYVKGMVRAMNRAGWDALAINMRSCSGEPNRLFSSYHSGRSEDIDTIIKYVLGFERYKSISLVGFSLGGNIILKYVGEKSADISEYIKSAVAISVPCDLRSSSIHLSKNSNKVYYERLIRSLKKKALLKKQLFPDAPYSAKDVQKVKTFHDFDNIYTAPAHEFKDANDYYAKCSSKQFLSAITCPTLLINALDDPFFPDACYPFEEAKGNSNFYFETPKYGGHVGFNHSLIPRQEFWHETRAVAFLRAATS